MKRDFKGVWIPCELWLDKSLKPIQKFFLLEIDSLDNDEGCFASNAHFSQLFGVTKGRCTQIIKELEEKKLITVKIERDGKAISRREIRVVKKLNTLVNKVNLGSKKIKQGYLENAEGNNTNVNNNNINIPDDIDRNLWEQWMKIRKHKQAVNSEIATRGLLKKLEQCVSAGYTRNESIEVAIENSWKSIDVEWVRQKRPLVNSINHGWGVL